MKAYVVSLEQDLQRRRHVCKQLKDIGLKAEIFYGIDGRTLTSEQVISLQHSNVRHLSGYQGELSKSEIGCLLSHKTVLEKSLLEDYIFVIEDDVDISESTKSFLAKLEELRLEFDVCMLGHHSGRDHISALRYRGRKLVGSHVVGRPVERCFGTYGYVISRQGMRKVIENLETICAPIDHYIGCYRSLNLLITKEPLVKINASLDAGSSIQEERLAKSGARKVSLYKNLLLYKFLKVSWLSLSNLIKKFK